MKFLIKQISTSKTELRVTLDSVDVNGIKWEKFNKEMQEEEIQNYYPEATKVKIELDWPDTIEGFREERSRVSDRTWKQKYLPVMNQLIKVMSGKNKPTNGPDLCDKALKKWEVGTR